MIHDRHLHELVSEPRIINDQQWLIRNQGGSVADVTGPWASRGLFYPAEDWVADLRRN